MDVTAIEQARQRIEPFIKCTALEYSQTLSEYLETNVSVKLELFQKTGSFKVRGAFNKLLTLTDEYLLQINFFSLASHINYY